MDCWRDGENSEISECSTVLRSDSPGATPSVSQPNVLIFQRFGGWEVLGWAIDTPSQKPN
ncbi:hypothetical protein [Microcoleus sp. herbarium14]|uniref:hypothetical protein n=1 Tax=Microcoleus sp. herbarium14 TaxID=3055439 RepID=UPI002FD047B8